VSEGSAPAPGELHALGARLAHGLETLAPGDSGHAGATPRRLVHEDGKVRLYRYLAERGAADATDAGGTPLLVVYALVNRPYMLDLQPDRSTLRGLLAGGVDVYLIDWGYPDAADRHLALADYLEGYLDGCVEHVRRARGCERVSLLGVCQGGTLSLCYAALHPDKVRSLVTMVTPVDFHTPDNVLSRWLRDVDVDALVDAYGNVPGTLLNWTFAQLKPLRGRPRRPADVLRALGEPSSARAALGMERWIEDSPDQAGEAFREFVREFFQRNALANGGVMLGGRRVHPGAVRAPVLNVYATEDHIVPPSASLALERLVGSDDYSTLSFRGGHIGIYVSARAAREVPPAIAAWLRESKARIR